jgi:hypothetical protein
VAETTPASTARTELRVLDKARGYLLGEYNNAVRRYILSCGAAAAIITASGSPG